MDSSVIIILASLLFSAYSSGMEIAFVSSNRLKVELDRSKNSWYSKLLNVFYGKDGHFLATLLLANNVGIVIFGIYMAEALDPLIASWGIKQEYLVVLLQTVISTLIVLSIAEFFPKVIFQINPNGIFRLGSAPMWVIYWLLYIPTKLIVWASNGLLRIFGIHVEQSEKVFSKTDLQHFVQDVNERMEEEGDLGNEIQILQNALDFSKIKARDCMVPRMEIEAIDVEESIENLLAKFVETRLSKLLLYRDSVDNIIGYVHSYELFKKPATITQILRPISFVPEAIPGKELLELFTKKSQSIAVVVDEYGGTSGVVTIEDVIEQIFGEIEDEHDDEDWLEEQISENSYRFSARAEISYLNRTYGLKLPESDSYETLGGLAINQLEAIPQGGEELIIGKWTLIVEEVTDRRIEIIRLIQG
ncbi:hemolysin family protein [Fluviicola sp.]|uniref:hemolysin family protein n=1 Tax=Fluviicola sp. TaxID=1917219 RepID=UPI002618EE98|nr:hemolysin family protein [Fluviicola sp.]